MTINTDVLRVKNYLRDTLISLAAQKESKFAQFVEQKKVSGIATFFDRIGNRSMTLDNSVHADSPINDQEFSRRMVILNKFIDGDMIDKAQILEIERDVKPAIAMKIVEAWNRKKDEVCYEALIGSAAGGEAGATAITLASYNSGSNVIAAGGAGLTITKIKQGLKQLRKNKVDVDGEGVVLMVDSEAYEDLLGITEFISRDYQGAQPMETGVVGQVLGCKVVHSPIMDNYGSAGDYRAVMFAPSALKMAVGYDLNLEMAPRPDKGFNFQIFAEGMIGATRLEEEKVIDIRLT